MIIGILLLATPMLHAQYTASDYLDWTKEHLDNGECDKAKETYALYKEKVPQGDAEVERRIAECEKASQSSTMSKEKLIFTVNGVSFNMIYVEGGTFTMGCTSEQSNDCKDNERPAHKVTLNSFYMGKTEVTLGLWRAVMGDELYNDTLVSEYISYSAYGVNWNNCQKFIQKFNEQLQLPEGWHFALPTEAQREFAARGGNQSRGYMYSGSNTLEDVAWYYENTFAKDSSMIHPVKRTATSASASPWSDDNHLGNSVLNKFSIMNNSLEY